MSRPTAQIMHEDLLYLIFLHALPSKIKSDGSRIEIGTVEPMNFSMVCRSWRAVVLSHSILWSRIIIHHDGYRPKPVSPSLRLFLSKWLRHSKNSPLSINFDLHRLDVKGDIVTKDIVAIALSQHSRLEDVVISLGYASTKEPFTIQISPNSPGSLYRSEAEIFEVLRGSPHLSTSLLAASALHFGSYMYPGAYNGSSPNTTLYPSPI